jgi:hypothetical protein
MSQTTKVEDIEVLPKTAEDFAKAYQELCDKMGYRIVVSPAYVARDDGSFSTVLQYTVGKLPNK